VSVPEVWSCTQVWNPGAPRTRTVLRAGLGPQAGVALQLEPDPAAPQSSPALCKGWQQTASEIPEQREATCKEHVK